jgi:hypothetical protein
MSRAEKNPAQPGRAAAPPFSRRFPGYSGATICALLLFSSPAGAQWDPDQFLVTRSVSGQFVVHAPRALESLALGQQAATPTNMVRLDPALLPVSCERIKQLLYREMGATAPWQSKIFIVLYASREPEPAPAIISERFRNGWRYRVELPNELPRAAYVRALLQVLLLEMANRTAQERSAEIPTWLIEGFTRQLLASSDLEIILQPPGTGGRGLRFTPTFVDARKDNPLLATHSEITGRVPLTFEQLSWPAPGQLRGEPGEYYSGSAHLFVSRLLRLENGRACLRTMIETLPAYYNWQFAFLHAFSRWFQRPLDVEKWWTLTVVHFSDRDLAQTWPMAESWEKLDQGLRAAIEIRSNTNDLPLRSEIPLQTVIAEWPPVQQDQVLQAKLRELDLLRVRVADDLVGLVDEYRLAIQRYLADKDRTGLIPFRKKAIRQHAARSTIETLNRLDARRAAIARAKPPLEVPKSGANQGAGPRVVKAPG